MARLQEVQVGGQAIVEAARERELRGEAVARCNYAGLELPGMPLELVAVLVNAAKIISASVNVQHDASTRLARLLALVVVGPHLDPLGTEGGVWLAPLPPLGAANLADALGSQLLLEEGCGADDLVLRDLDLLDLDPLRMRDPLGREGLELLDRVVRCVEEEGPDEVEALVVG